MARTLGILRENLVGERRVALLPAVAAELASDGFQVVLEAGAGEPAGFSDADYEEAGVEVRPDRPSALEASDVVLRVNALGAEPATAETDIAAMRAGQILVALCAPLDEPALIQRAAERGLTVFSLEMIPRITRAQSMDVLSSMATVAGYKAVLLAAYRHPRMFPMMMTAAGTNPPARVFVLGAGVAGLQAMATAKRLGGVVEGYDIRPAAKDQVVSVGARFVELPIEAEGAEDAGGYARAMDERFYQRQRELLASVVAHSDVVITTAAVPGKKAPVLVTEDMVKSMPKGAIVVDLAAARGGNCELTKAGEDVRVGAVTVMGPLNLPGETPIDASRMFSRNLRTFVRHAIPVGGEDLDLGDEIVSGTLAACGGEVVNSRLREALGLPERAEPTAEENA